MIWLVMLPRSSLSMDPLPVHLHQLTDRPFWKNIVLYFFFLFLCQELILFHFPLVKRPPSPLTAKGSKSGQSDDTYFLQYNPISNEHFPHILVRLHRLSFWRYSKKQRNCSLLFYLIMRPQFDYDWLKPSKITCPPRPSLFVFASYKLGPNC